MTSKTRSSERQVEITRADAQKICTLLVSSCDRYSDLWRPYFALLERLWPDCPFPVKLITDSIDPRIEGVCALPVGENTDWSTALLRALDRIQTPYVLFTLEDFFLRREPDTTRLLLLLHIMQQRKFRMMRLVPRRPPNMRVRGTRDYGLITPGAPYRVSTQAAYWDVHALRSLLRPGETAWEFEINGTQRSKDIEGFAGVWAEALPYGHHVIERGRWFPWEARRFSKLNIGVDLSARPVMSLWRSAAWMMRKGVGSIKKYARNRRAATRARSGPE